MCIRDSLGRMMDMVKAGKDANEAIKEATGTYGRFLSLIHIFFLLV